MKNKPNTKTQPQRNYINKLIDLSISTTSNLIAWSKGLVNPNSKTTLAKSDNKNQINTMDQPNNNSFLDDVINVLDEADPQKKPTLEDTDIDKALAEAEKILSQAKSKKEVISEKKQNITTEDIDQRASKNKFTNQVQKDRASRNSEPQR